MASGSRKEYELLFKLKAALGSNFNSNFKTAMDTTKKLQNTLGKINSLSGKIDGYKKQSDAIEKSKQRLGDLNAEHEKLQREMKQTEIPSESLRKKFEKNERQIEETTTRIGEQEKKLGELGTELRKAGVNTNNLETANGELAKSYEKIKKKQEELAKITAAQQKNAEQISKVKGQLLGTAGVITAVGAAIYAGPVKSSMEFQTAMAKVGTIADESIMPLGAMQKEILRLSNAMGVSANAIAEDVYNAISAGQNTGDAVNFVAQATKLAKGGFAETGQALDVLTTILNAYGMESSEATKVSDMLIQTQNKGKVTVAELASVMGKIIPTAKTNNVALEQLGAGYAKMTSKGISAAESTTYMNSMLNEMGKTGSKADKALRETTGSSFKELMASGKSLAEVLEVVDGAAKDGGLSLSDMFGSSEAGKAALTIMSDGVKGFNNSVLEMVDSAGVAEKAFNKMMDAPKNKEEKAKTSLKNLSIVLGNTFLPNVGEAAEKVSELVTKFANFAEENPELIKTVAKVATGLAALKVGSLVAKLGFLKLKGGVLGIQKVIKLFTSDIAVAGVETVKNVTGMSKSVTLLKSAFTLLTGPVGIAITAIAAITAGVLLFKNAQEKARQRTLNFSKDLKTAADSFQKVNDNVNETKTLIEEYRNLEKQINDVATSADEAAAAKQRMKEIEDALIEQHPDVISKYDQENGKISENLGLIERKLQKELELAKIQYEQKQYEAEQKLPDALKEIANLNAKTQSLREQYEASKKVRDGLLEISQEWEVFYASNPGQEELNKKLDELTDKAAELGKVVGESWDFDGSGMAGIQTTYLEYANKVSKTVGDVTKKQEELNTATQSVKDYYDASVKLTELDLGGNFQTVASNIAAMNTELANLEKKGEGGSKRALEIKDEIAELQPKLLDAAAKIRDLGLAIKEVPEVKAVNVTDATKNIDGFIEKLNQIPTSKRIQLIVQQSGGSIPGYATGGIITKPTLATFAEKVPEAAIPIDGSENAKRLWLKTGQLLGMNTRPIFNNTNKAQTQNNYSEVKEVVMIAPALQAILSAAKTAARPSGEVLPQLQQVYKANTAVGVEAPTVKAGSISSTKIEIMNQPIIHIDGNKPDELDEKLKKNNEDLLNKMDEKMRKKEEDERRVRYE